MGTVAQNSRVELTADVALSGYTPFAVTYEKASHNDMWVNKCILNTSTQKVTVTLTSQSAYSDALAVVRVLYKKN